jgi:XTP/dITP diphosphohydrolase
MKLVLATKNPGKLRELFQLNPKSSNLELELSPNGFNPDETGSTYQENATIKAVAAAKLTGGLCLGEDSGIEVDALNGRPGIYSARYCPGSDQDRVHKLLNDLKGKSPEERTARYVCAMTLVDGLGRVLHQTIGKWEGQIAFREAGHDGFGYDPIFYLPREGKTAAQLSSQEKNQVSHRAQAFLAMLEFLACRTLDPAQAATDALS